jgi:hypothetical protein
MAGAGMVAVSVSNDGAVDRTPRIDKKVSGRAVQPLRTGDYEIHTLREVAVRGGFDRSFIGGRKRVTGYYSASNMLIHRPASARIVPIRSGVALISQGSRDVPTGLHIRLRTATRNP